MRIAVVIPGSGGSFYCQNCDRDFLLAGALRAKGHDVISIPMYLPLMGDRLSSQEAEPLFFGGVNVWLQQHLPLFRRTPAWVDRIFDSPPLLQLAAGMAASTRAASLGRMTLSLLQGEEGNHAKELDRMADWLAEEGKPEVVHLSNALLLGLARRFRERIGAPVICALQDESPWLDAMKEPWRSRCWEVLRERAREADAFIAFSRSYAETMAGRLDLPRKRVSVVHLGVDPALFRPSSLSFDPPILGYMDRLSEGNGLGVLAETFLTLKTNSRHRRLRLRLTGGMTADDRHFLRGVLRRLSRAGLAGEVEIVSDFSPSARADFLASLSLFSVPGVEQTASGLAVLEAMASGVPVVQPERGAFSEILEGGGGILYHPDDPKGLARALDRLLSDPGEARRMGRTGREQVLTRFTRERMAEEFVAVCRETHAARGR